MPTHDGEPTAITEKKATITYGSGEHLLLVDDEEDPASPETAVLQRPGYRVTSEVSSIETLKTFSRRPNDLDLVITDQTMPNMSGVDLAKVLLGIRPRLPIILATGYSISATDLIITDLIMPEVSGRRWHKERHKI